MTSGFDVLPEDSVGEPTPVSNRKVRGGFGKEDV
jgi:hypothetical protein